MSVRGEAPHPDYRVPDALCMMEEGYICDYDYCDLDTCPYRQDHEKLKAVKKWLLTPNSGLGELEEIMGVYQSSASLPSSEEKEVQS